MATAIKLQPQKDRGYNQHGKVVLSIFLISSGKATALFESVETALNLVPLAVWRLVKLSSALLIVFAGNGDANTPATQIEPNFMTAVSLIAHGTTSAWTLDAPLLHQLFKHHCFMSFPHHQQKGDWQL